MLITHDDCSAVGVDELLTIGRNTELCRNGPFGRGVAGKQRACEVLEEVEVELRGLTGGVGHLEQYCSSISDQILL